MDSFNQKVERINTAKEAIKTSLTNKGMNPSNNIEDYASLIDSIEQDSGSGSKIHVYDSIEAMQENIALFHENDICKIQEDIEYYVPINDLEQLNNVIIPHQFMIAKLAAANTYNLTYANADETEYLKIKKSILQTKFTIVYKLLNEEEVTLSFSYNDTLGGYASTLTENLTLEFSEMLTLTNSASLGTVKAQIKSLFSKTVLTYIYQFNGSEFKILQGFNPSIATVASDLETAPSLGKTGDLAVIVTKSNEPIQAETEYKFIAFPSSIKVTDLAVGDYSISLSSEPISGSSSLKGLCHYKLNYVVSESSISLSISLDTITGILFNFGEALYNINEEGTTYELQTPVIWELAGEISLIGMSGTLNGLKITETEWNDAYSILLAGASDFKGLYQYSLETDSLSIMPNQFTADASDIIQGKTAYTLGGVKTGTAPELGVLEITPSTAIQSKSGGFVQSIKIKAVDATIDDNIQPDNIKSGLSILGVEGNDRLSFIKFNSLEEAQAYDKYKFNDKAIIVDIEDVPFYPEFLHTDYPNFSSYSYSSSMEELVYEPFILLPRDEVTLDEVTTLSAEAAHTTTGNKAKSYGFKIDISSTACNLTVFSSFLGLNDVVFKYQSTDGLTYTLNEVTNNGTVVSYIKYASLYWSSSIMSEVYNALKANWDNIKLISKFLYFPQKEQLKGIYTYLPANKIPDNNTPFYLVDLNNVVFKNNTARLSLLQKGYTGQQFIDYATAAGLTDSDRGYAILKDGRVIMTAYPLILKDNKGNYFFGSSNSATSHTIYNPADGTVTTGTNVSGYNWGPYTAMKIIDINEVEVIVRRTTYNSETKWANPVIYYVEDTSQADTVIYGIYGGYYAKCNPQLIPFDGYRSDLNINDLLINGASSISAQEEIELNNVLDNIYGGAE